MCYSFFKKDGEAFPLWLFLKDSFGRFIWIWAVILFVCLLIIAAPSPF